MKICTIISDMQIIDANYYANLQWAVREVLKGNDEIEYLLLDGNVLCFSAVLELRQECPNKTIKISMVGKTSAAAWESEELYMGIPACALDRFLIPPNNTHNICKWATNRSDYLIYYHYDALSLNNRAYEYTQRKTLVVLDITQPNRRFIENCMQTWMDSNEKELYALLMQRKKYREIAQETGLSIKGAQLRAKKLMRKLGACIKYEKKRSELESPDNPLSHPIICSLLDFDITMTKNKTSAIKQAMAFFVKRFPECLFLVEESMCDSVMVSVACDMTKQDYFYWNQTKSTIGIVAPCPQNAESIARLKSKYVPPFHSVLHMEQEDRRSIWSMMTGISDYVLCSGATNAKIASLRQSANMPPEIMTQLKVLHADNILEEIAL